VGLFRDFTWPGDLENFSQVNLIYGWNGTGKTTLSRLLDRLGSTSKTEDLNSRTWTDDEKLSIWVDGKEIEASDFPTESYKIKVFNRDFIYDNILTKDSTEPIIYVGTKSVTIQQDLSKLQTEINQKREDLLMYNQKLSEANEKLENYMTQEASKIKNKLFSAGSGIKAYQHYNRVNYKRSVDKIVKNDSQFDEHSSPNLSSAELLNEIKRPAKSKVEFFEHIFPDLKITESKIVTILQTKVVNKVIEKLQNDPSLEDWIKEGLTIYRQSESGLCPWCEQEPTANRIAELNDHYNTSFEELLREVDICLNEIDLIVENIPDIKSYNNYDLYHELMDEYSDALSELDRTIIEIHDWLNHSKSDLDNKRKKMNSAVNLAFNSPIIDAAISQSFNDIISQHNKKSETRAEEIEGLCKEYEQVEILKNINFIQELQQPIDDYSKLINDIEDEIEKLSLKVTQLESKAFDVQTPLEELNSEIFSFLGHRELQFVKSGAGYNLVRDGNTELPSDTLSEGEKTVIALLYFLKSIYDSNFDLSAGIVVFDDPVSSLDSNYLYQAFAAITDIISNVCQTFIFTHNFALFSEIKRKYDFSWKGRENTSNKKFSTYILEIEMKDGNRSSEIKPLHKILRDYNSEYYYLFSCLIRIRDFESSIVNWHYNLPNMARRFLETFLDFRYPGKKNFSEAIEAAKFDSQKKTSINRYLNKFSHRDTITPSGQQEDPMAEARQVVNYILEMVEDLDPGHYKQMVKIIEKTSITNDKKILFEVLHSYRSSLPILKAYFHPGQNNTDPYQSPSTELSGAELILIAEVEGDVVQRYKQFNDLMIAIQASGIDCWMKVYTPEEIKNITIPSSYDELMD